MKDRKKTMVRGLTALLMVFLLLGAPAARGADDVITVTAVRGSYVRALLSMPGGETLREHTVLDGHPAPGLLLRSEGEGLALVGTPTELGEWTMIVHIRTDSGEKDLRIEQYIVTPESNAVPTAAPIAAPTPEATATPAPTATPEPTLAPTPEGLPPITKHPGSERLSEGGTAIFVAKAEQAEKIEWYLADPHGGEASALGEVIPAFPDVLVSGQGTGTLSLTGIPAEMSGWQIECRFTGPTGAVSVSDRATVTVRPGLAAPHFLQLPEGLELYAGESGTLSVRAMAPEDSQLRFQWYSASTPDLASILAVEGAVEDTFAPPAAEGTVYYCVGVRSVKGAEESSAAFSPLVAVTGYAGAREHIHDFSGPWRSNAATHWRECECGERREEAYHDLRWTVTKEATGQTVGERQGVCSVCGYETTETIPMKETSASRMLLLCLAGIVAVLLVLMAVFVIYNVRRTRRLRRKRRSGSYSGTHMRK